MFSRNVWRLLNLHKLMILIVSHCSLIAATALQLRGLLDERADVEIPVAAPQLEMVVDGQVDSDDSGVEFELEQTVYVNDSQEPLTDTLEQGFDESDELLSA